MADSRLEFARRRFLACLRLALVGVIAHMALPFTVAGNTVAAVAAGRALGVLGGGDDKQIVYCCTALCVG